MDKTDVPNSIADVIRLEYQNIEGTDRDDPCILKEKLSLTPKLISLNFYREISSKSLYVSMLVNKQNIASKMNDSKWSKSLKIESNSNQYDGSQIIDNKIYKKVYSTIDVNKKKCN